MDTGECLAVFALLLLAAVARTAAAPRPQSGEAKQSAAATENSSTAAPSANVALRANTRLISVDVVVADSHGEPVRGLTRDDFRVFDDGNGPQKIARIEYVDHSAVPAAAPTKAATAEAAPVYSNQKLSRLTVPPTVLLLDPGSISFQDQVWAHLQALDLLKQLPADTPVAVFVLRGGLSMTQNFTTDRALLRAAVDRSMSGPAQVKNPENETDNGQNRDLPSNSFGQSVRDFEKLEYAEQTTVIANQTSDAMVQIAKDLSGYPGPKSLIWISEAFPQWIAPGSGFGPHQDDAMSSPFRQAFQASANYGATIHSDAEALIDAHVTVYPVDARGLETEGLYSASGNLLATDSTFASRPATIGPAMGSELVREDGDRVFAQASMDQIADETGGKDCKNTNDLSGCANAAVKSGASYYELDYYPENVRWDGSFHKIAVKTTARGAHLRYAGGYFAVDTLGIAKERPQEFFEQACSSLLPETSIALSAETLKPAKPDEGRYLISMPASGLDFVDSAGARTFNLRLAVCEYSANGAAFRVYTRDISQAATEETGRPSRTEVIQNIFDYQAKPYAKRLRFAVLDVSTGLTGTVDVPAHPTEFASVPIALRPAASSKSSPKHVNFHGASGEVGSLNWSTNELTYEGDLSINLAVPAFFHHIYGEKFHCEMGKLIANDPKSRDTPNLVFSFRNPAGLALQVDLAGGQPSYSGGLQVDAKAQAFFERLGKLCHCTAP